MRVVAVAVVLALALTVLASVTLRERAPLALRADSSAPAFVGVETAVKKGSKPAQISVDVPVGENGDLLIAILATDGEPTLTAPVGWTLVDSGTAQGDKATLGIWRRLADGSEPGSYTFTWDVKEPAVAAILRYRGVDGAGPVTMGGFDTGRSNAPTAPEVTTTVNNALILRIYAVDGGDHPVEGTSRDADGCEQAGTGYPSGNDGRYSCGSSGGSGVGAGAADAVLAVAGPSGAAAFDLLENAKPR